MLKLRFVLGTLILIALPTAAAAGHPAAAYGERLGTVELPAECGDAARPRLEAGLALLHHMTYEGAREAFQAATAADPECALAYWGEAMTYIHPLWSDPPSEAEFERGRSLLATARERARNERELAWIAAAEGYYARGWSRAESENLAGFERGWAEAHRRFPNDPEAVCFYALSQLGTADPGDKTYTQQRRAGALAREVLSRVPDHPGAHHYTIHAYDYPPLAADALAVARAYGDIAPAVPHALHMPTHIFTRLGLWGEAIDWNRRSAEAALHHPVGDAISTHHLHALDYLAYAHLQRGEDRKAGEVAAAVAALAGPFQAELATPYTLAAVPARLALERQRWAEAAALEPRIPAAYPWDRAPAMEAITHFARALGAARSGDPERARQALARIEQLRDEAAKTSAYWAKQVEIQRLSALAWLIYSEGDHARALGTMGAAADLEATTEKHPVTPGEVLPARELLAEMLLELGRHDEALAEFEAVLERSPGRLNSLWGAGRAAELAGDDEGARTRFAALRAALAPGADADTGWSRLAHARSYLASRRIGG